MPLPVEGRILQQSSAGVVISLKGLWGAARQSYDSNTWTSKKNRKPHKKIQNMTCVAKGFLVVLCWLAVGYLTQAHSSALLPTTSTTAAITGSRATKHNRKKRKRPGVISVHLLPLSSSIAINFPLFQTSLCIPSSKPVIIRLSFQVWAWEQISPD